MGYNTSMFKILAPWRAALLLSALCFCAVTMCYAEVRKSITCCLVFVHTNVPNPTTELGADFLWSSAFGRLLWHARDVLLDASRGL